MTPAPEPKFLADCMLGKLARWLTVLGYDSRFAPSGAPERLRGRASGERPAHAPSDAREDMLLLDEAQKEGRIFLTRDTRIPDVKGLRKIVLREQRFEDQLRRVLKETGLTPDPKRFFTRCTLCNQATVPVAREEALPKVPEKVRGLETDFFRCPACGRFYWTGTHVENTLAKLRRMGI
ncbi:MAG: hypothetical protein HY922_10020 [Elusimicrobia bacterium]|nr:hypothetical protein [Elusimicrobiota bacterium]